MSFRSFMLAIRAAVLLGSFGSLPGTVAADCSTPGVHLNEIRFLEGKTPLSGTLHPVVELYNNSGATVGLGGWSVRDLDADLLATLPSVSLPNAAFLMVVFGSGTNELDFSDGLGTFYTGGSSTGIFNASEDAAALYSGAPASGTIVDFVQWSLSGSPLGGNARTHATTASIWTVGDHVALDTGQTLYSIRLLPDGYDTNSGTDWDEAGWGESRYGAALAGPNAIQLAPANETGLAPGAVTFSWTPVEAAVSYELEITTDPSFAVIDVADAAITSTDSTLTLGPGTYYWRVRMQDACGAVNTSAAWRVSIFTGTSTPPMANLIGVIRETQHKDSKLLCIWNDKAHTRPGCSETADAQGPWDGSHAANHAAQTVVIGGKTKEIHCQHCAYYCMRACVQMLNHHFGGDLLQDRISYEYMLLERAASRVVASPEGDLGHRWPALIASLSSVLGWAVTGSSVSGPSSVSFTDVKTDVDAGRPLIGLIRGTTVSHVVVIDGYAEPGAFGVGIPSKRMYRVRDPWPGSGSINGWVAASESGIADVWRISGAGLTGRRGPRSPSSRRARPGSARTRGRTGPRTGWPGGRCGRRSRTRASPARRPSPPAARGRRA